MAKRHHRRHGHRRRYGDLGAIVSVPGLGFVGRSVPLGSVLAGALVAMGTSAVLKFALSQSQALMQSVPTAIQNNMPLVAGVLSGTVLYLVSKDSGKKVGRAFGAVFGGGVHWIWDNLRTSTPQYFGDVVTLQYGQYGQYKGLFVNDSTPQIGPGAFRGMIVDDSSSGRNLAELAALDSQDIESEALFDT